MIYLHWKDTWPLLCDVLRVQAALERLVGKRKRIAYAWDDYHDADGWSYQHPSEAQ